MENGKRSKGARGKQGDTFDSTSARNDRSLFGGSVDYADNFDLMNKENDREQCLHSPEPMSIEVINNESVFSEALD